MKDYSDLSKFADKKLRTLRNNLNNRIESFTRGGEKALPASHMLFNLDAAACKELKERVFAEMKKRSK